MAVKDNEHARKRRLLEMARGASRVKYNERYDLIKWLRTNGKEKDAKGLEKWMEGWMDCWIVNHDK